jgi:glutamate-1-semialdehyde 2,1-aminomutase
MNIESSKKIFQASQKVLVGGVNSPVRSFKRVGGDPIVLQSGAGAFVHDVDKNKYCDLVMGYGPHLFGHAHPKIVEHVTKSLRGSTGYGFLTPDEVSWAERVLKLFPSSEKVRVTSSGTEATSTAIRLARGYTGREIIVKFAGHYNGHVDSLMVDSGSGLATLAEGTATADSKGLPDSLIALSRVTPFNDISSLQNLFSKEGDKIAAIIMEPVMGNMGVVPPNVEFLKACRSLTQKHGALLIFDEVMTGLRVAKMSAQGRYDVKPDLTCLAKIVGGGLPLGAILGAGKIMDTLAPLGPVYQAGTFSGNPVSISAGLGMLELIEKENPYSRLEDLGQWLESVIVNEAEKNKLEVRVERVGSMISTYFRSGAVVNAEDCKNVRQDRFKTFFWALVEEGVLIPPSPFEAYFLSTAHDNVQVKDLLAKAFSNALAKVKRENP